MNEESEAESPQANLVKRYEAILQKKWIVWNNERPLVRCLGGGGQGVVYLSIRRGADDFTLPVAIKLFSPSGFATPGEYEAEMRRLARVAARVARIQHDNLIYVHNFIRQDDIHLMEMEWVDGYDLQQLLRPDALQQVREHVTARRWASLNDGVVTAGADQSRLKPAIAVGVIRECLAGLAALHRAGIVHSDLKPSNIMLKRSGNVKLVDIGSAYERIATPHGQACTPAYAAPEVLKGSRGTFASDLASLGYILLELLSGRNPFAGLPYRDLVQAKMTIHRRLSHVLPTEEFAFSEPLMLLIRGLIHPDPRQRFASAEAAALNDDGAAGFLRQLVKGDLSSEYENDIRKWVEEIEADFLMADAARGLSSEQMELMSTRFQDVVDEAE